jgi:hypothetical protein
MEPLGIDPGSMLGQRATPLALFVDFALEHLAL